MNNRGGIVLRDLFYIIMLVSGIFVLSGVFVNEMAISYDNELMYSEFNQTGVYTDTYDKFYETSGNLSDSGDKMSRGGGLSSFLIVIDSLDAAGDILGKILTFPNSMGSLAKTTLISLEIDNSLAAIVGFLITSLLWALILFAIVTAFLKGGKM